MPKLKGQDRGDAGLVFVAHNNHDERCGPPPRLRNTDNHDLYYGYFENRYGEQFVFTFDRATGTGMVSGGDLGWDDPKAFTLGLLDGGNGLEDQLCENFPRVEVIILDLFHPAEKLTGLARLLHPEDEDRAEDQAWQWRCLLKEEGGAVLAAVLSEWEWPRRPGVSEAARELIGYQERNAHRMEYPEYLAQGWCIGSGAVESACKTVVGQRLKLAGMRWGEDGAHALCHLRALYRSEKGQWDAFWRRDFSRN